MQKKIFQAKSATSIIVARVRSTYLTGSAWVTKGLLTLVSNATRPRSASDARARKEAPSTLRLKW